MKRTLLATSIGCSIAALLGLVHCSQPATTYQPPGGGAGSPSAGGSPPSAGAPAAGGETTLPTAGSTSVAGSSGSLGVAGSAGASTGGATGVSGGAGAGTAGSSGAMGGAGAPGLSVTDVFGIKNSYGDALADSFILFPCYSKAGQDCITIPSGAACPNQDNTALPYEQRGVQFHEDFHIGGTPGAMYIATIHVDGITEAKYYEKGTRAAGLTDPPAATTNTFVSCTAPDPAHCTDAFYTGGDPVDAEHYNVYKLTVYGTPDAADGGPGTELQHYYLNSFPANTGTAYEQHSTYYVSYSHDIPVVGGGVIEYKMGDQNCHAIDNCGPGYFTTDCTATDKNAGRKLPNITIPSTYLGKQVSVINAVNGANQPYHSHVLHITVTAVRPM
jgi:hypothetical protein